LTSSDSSGRLRLSRQLAAYSYRTSLQVRYGDIDAVGHLNNAVTYGLHDEAQNRFWTQQLGLSMAELREVRPMHRQTDYLRIGRWPSPLIAGVGILGWDSSAVRIGSALFQSDRCINLQECLIAATLENAALLSRVSPTAIPAIADSEASISRDALDPQLLDPQSYSFRSALTPRFADLDVAGRIGASAIARHAEQARSDLMRHIIHRDELPRGSLRGVVGSVKVWELVPARSRNMELASSVRRITPRSVHFGLGIFGDARCIAYCESVHVFVDRQDKPTTPAEVALRALRQWL